VTISFKINNQGGLSSVAIVKKSGSDALDRAAVKQIQRAAPFPKPPAGARQSFTIVMKGI
jgi:protein TonB